MTKEPLSVRIGVRVTEGQHRTLAADASEAGVTVSTYVRKMIQRHLVEKARGRS